MLVEPFDDLFDDQPPERPEAASRDYKVVPEGRTEVEIVAATIGDVPWKTTESNPRGECLRLRLSAGRKFQFVFADVPLDRQPLLRAVADAVGLEPAADGRVAFNSPNDLVGRRIRVDVGSYQNRAGQTKACVRRWVRMKDWKKAEINAAAPPVKRSRNAVRPAGDDEIPF